ncbi:MAG: response regulator [Planctomycetota bacterium]|nr:response regulator [Planctomycetota bacterium]
MNAFTSGERVRVVVIDDDIALGNVLVESLRQRGYLAEAVADPRQAEEKVAVLGAQVVLCDICMPGLNGIDLAQRLKQREPATQIIIMTGYASQETVDEAFAAGVCDYLLKPFTDLQEVFRAVDKAAQQLRACEDELRAAIRREFPDEYTILYAGSASGPPEDLDSLIAEVEQAAAAEEKPKADKR